MNKRFWALLTVLVAAVLAAALPQVIAAFAQAPITPVATPTSAPAATPTPRVIVLSPTPAPESLPPTPEPTKNPAQIELFQSVIESWLVPLWQQDKDNSFLTVGECVGIVNHLTESGLTMTRDWRNALWGGAYSTRSEFLEQLLTWQLGNGSQWTVEQSHWAGEIRVACGLQKENPHLLPAAGELTQAEATELAEAAVMEQFGVTLEWLEKCSAFFTFSLSQEPDTLGERMWRFDFYPIGDPWQGYYRVWLDANGGSLRAEKIG